MTTNDSKKRLVLERLSVWREKGATLLFTFTETKSRFSITVSVLGVSEESVSLRWILNATDAQGVFLVTDGHFVIWLEGAEVSLSNDTEPAVAISHGEFHCVLTVIRPTAF
jgi:hypothetical protein